MALRVPSSVRCLQMRDILEESGRTLLILVALDLYLVGPSRWFEVGKPADFHFPSPARERTPSGPQGLRQPHRLCG